MPVVTCPHCSNSVTLPDPWTAPGYTCPHCHRGVPIRILAPVSHSSTPPPPERRDPRPEDRRRNRREGRERYPVRPSFIQAHPLLFAGGILSAITFLFVVACCGGLIYSSGARREAAQKELAEANALWDAGNKAEAASKYARVLDRDYSDLPPAAEKPVVYQRVIDQDLERGDKDAARARIEKALDKKIDIAPGSPALTQLIAQVRAARERREAEERAAREAEDKRKREEAARRDQERAEAEAKRRREELEKPQISVELLQARDGPFRTADGLNTRMVYTDWKNTGNGPVRAVHATIIAFDSRGRELYAARDYTIYAVPQDDAGIAPGETYIEPQGMGHVLPPLLPRPVARFTVKITRADEKGN